MFGHQDNDQDGTKNSTNPALPGSFPALPSAPADGPADDFNPALPNKPSEWADNVTAPAPATDPAAASASNTSTDELLDIKQQALSQLSPLVSHLEQTPEEKFRTTMMMIQATDNQDLVKDAYAAAQSITDEKTKAQALLDIVNEINYFTQHHQG